MIGRRGFIASVLAPAFSSSIASAQPPSGARRVSFNEGWRFRKGEAEGAELLAFADADWSAVRVPHDWAIAGPFDPKLNPHTGALPFFGIGWYRKTFTIPESARDRYFAVEFDGAMSNAQVWLNGQRLGERPYGYIGFSFDLTPHLTYGAGRPNVLAVRLAPEDHSSRWYPGAGIYRNVWLDNTGPIHVARWGTFVTTREITDARARIAVKTELRNRSSRQSGVTLRTSVLDAGGRPVADTRDMVALPAGSTTVESTLAVPRPRRWDIEDPYLYTLASEVLVDGRVADRYLTPFGIRAFTFERQRGFVLNGRPLKLHGVCNHHDLGALGAAVNRRAIERQLQILQAAGVNAIRTSHNPPAPELLDLCDRMGLLVMDEAFDMWRVPKVPNGYSKYYGEWSERDARDMVRRDRNHPSIVLWSIGNEVSEQGRPDGWVEAKRLTGFFHEEDPTRPTTSAFNNWEPAIRNKLADQVDVPGFNYQPMHYEQIRNEHPSWIIYGSETASAVSSRGVYHLPLEKYDKHPSLQISSYDVVTASWAYIPDVEFAVQDRFPGIPGEFVWTGFDYLGEPTPYFGYHPGDDNSHDWPARSSYFGMVDLAGFPKDRYYLYQSVWSKKPMVHLLPHWNWEGREGQEIPVMCYSNGEEVELLFNGASLGRKRRGVDLVELPVGPNVNSDRKFATPYRLMWKVPYRPGTLRAVAYWEGKPVAAAEVRTAGAPARVALLPDRNAIRADGDDLSFVTVRIEDRDGILCPAADHLVRFSVTGAGFIQAVDNGNAATVEPFHADRRKAFNGLALLIVRSQPGQPGRVRVTAEADGLASATVELVAAR